MAQQAPLPIVNGKVVLTEEEWEQRLSPEVFSCTRKDGTERAFTGKYHDHHEKGTYSCACCGQQLYLSNTKFDSGTGWPSFFQTIQPDSVSVKTDNSLKKPRLAVECSRCDAHLGHVFDDGPEPTGKRYCMNSVALDFIPGK